jgi:hypothetical protein
MTRAIFACIAVAVLGSPLPSQRPIAPAARCDRIDTTANWYRAQAAWWALESRHDWSDDSLRTRLLAVGALFDAGPTSAMPIQFGAMIDKDEMVTGLSTDKLREVLLPARQLLRDMAAKRSWPLRSTVGPAGVRAAWQIASGDSALAGLAMHRMMEAGPGEVSPADVAVMEDRMRLRTGRKQIYASQFDSKAKPGSLIPAPTEDLAHVDLRRDAAGLPPLPLARCALKTRPLPGHRT